MFRSAWLGLMVVVALAVWCTANVAQAVDKTHEGTVVSAGTGKLVMNDATGKEQTHVISDAVRITVNGKPGKLDDLKAGMRIQVTTDETGKVTAVSTVDVKKE